MGFSSNLSKGFLKPNNQRATKKKRKKREQFSWKQCNNKQGQPVLTPLTIIGSFVIEFQVANECPNRSTNNGGMAEIAKRPVSGGVRE